jgi:hypothetical protein
MGFTFVGSLPILVVFRRRAEVIPAACKSGMFQLNCCALQMRYFVAPNGAFVFLSLA